MDKSTTLGTFLCLILLIVAGREPAGSADPKDSTDAGKTFPGKTVLVDFENGIPCSDRGDPIGFRKKDVARAVIVAGGAEGTRNSALFKIGPADRDIYLQSNVRRKYLATGSEEYREAGPNSLSFWIKLPEKSSLITQSRNPSADTLGVWTYHWRYGDMGVGGRDNKSLTTDSMMHGYCNIHFNNNASSRWVRVILSPSAFKISRDYYHFYAAQGATDDLKFFPSLRQLQLRVFGSGDKDEDLYLDEVALIYQQPTSFFEHDFFKGSASVKTRDYYVPVTIHNPTGRTRRYRVFISSFLGVEREYLNRVFALTDSLPPMREIQDAVQGDGGIGAADLISGQGNPIIAGKKEVVIPAGGVWKGRLVHRIRPEMLGDQIVVKSEGREFHVRRDTLTTSVIVWDPEDPMNAGMDFLAANPSNSDDGKHGPPPGFPRQTRPPEGWRSEDIPLNQMGGYFVSVLTLTD